VAGKSKKEGQRYREVIATKNRELQQAQESQSSQPPPITLFRLDHYQGPIPPPELLAKFNDLVPNGAERIFCQFEAQSEHRRSLEKLVITSDQTRAYLGLACGTVVSLGGFTVAGICIAYGQTLPGLATVLSIVATLAGVFVSGTNSRKKERIEKSRLQTPAPPNSNTKIARVG
jgi:uncharacterized membrane protein